jgi:ATP/maltotriose-dependent transcriptional regulator MalT
LRVLRTFWEQGNIQQAIKACLSAKDDAVTVDFLSRAEESLGASNALDLNLAKTLIPLIQKLLSSSFESYVTLALRYTQMLVRSFGDMVVATRAQKGRREGLSIAGEERLIKCNALHAMFVEIDAILKPLAERHGGVRSVTQETRQLLAKVVARAP